MKVLSWARRQPVMAGALALVLVIGVVGVIAPWIAPFDPESTSPLDAFQPPSRSHWLGTDQIGMDIFSRVIYAPRIDLLVATAAVSLALLIGIPFGLVAGYYSERVSDIMMRFTDIFQSFPAIILALILIVVVGESLLSIIIVIAVAFAPVYIRLMRSQILSVREEPHVEAARAVGNPDWRIFWRHILPYVAGPVLAQSCVNIGWAILITAGLAFIGVGIKVPTPEWGSMVGSGAESMITGEWWISLFPGLAIMVTVIAFNFVSEGLQDMLEPQHG